MAEYILSKRAKNDLLEIADYTAHAWSQEQAETYLRQLYTCFHRLAKKPQEGRSYDLIRAGLRGHPCGRHIVFYRILEKEKIRIVRVLHERMDYARRFV